MIDIGRRFARLAWRKGFIQATLAAASEILPTPYAQRARFTAEFLTHDLSWSTWRTHMRQWRAGLSPKAAAVYNGAGNCSKYVTTLDEQYFQSINGPARDWADNKQQFTQLLRERGHGELVPEEFGTLSSGVLEPGENVLSILDEEGRLVIKDRTGSAGDRVHIAEATSDRYRLDGTDCDSSELWDSLGELDGYLVTEFCQPADYATSIFAETPNTLRIVTMNPDDAEPFIARAVHRIGSQMSGHVDNFSQGGLSAPVREEGTLGPAVRYLDGTVSWHETHPDTGARIEGVIIPDWAGVSEAILSAAVDLPELPYLGWDVIITDDGPRVIEANANTDTDLLQAHGSLVADERVRRFYREMAPDAQI